MYKRINKINCLEDGTLPDKKTGKNYEYGKENKNNHLGRRYG
jgi:hypothetical protein